ncbi:MAG: hypothetical protein J6334_06545, partial [Kiritimatiellae bacterium]|nr:hypothetical protein [Kiritimatiellia bacterium]
TVTAAPRSAVKPHKTTFFTMFFIIAQSVPSSFGPTSRKTGTPRPREKQNPAFSLLFRKTRWNFGLFVSRKQQIYAKIFQIGLLRDFLPV